MADPRDFQLRRQTLVLLTQAVQESDQSTDLMVQVDALIDELESAWQSGDNEHLRKVKAKAEALTSR